AAARPASASAPETGPGSVSPPLLKKVTRQEYVPVSGPATPASATTGAAAGVPRPGVTLSSNATKHGGHEPVGYSTLSIHHAPGGKAYDRVSGSVAVMAQAISG